MIRLTGRWTMSLILTASLFALALTGTPVTAAAPTLTILSPANNAIIGNGSPVAVIYGVSNFNLTKPGSGGAPSPNEGHVQLFVDGALAMTSYRPTVVLSLGSGIHTIELQLVADNGSALNPDVRESVSVTVTQGPSNGRPTIRITYPTEGLARGTDNQISFEIRNFALVPPGAAPIVPNEGHIRAFVDGKFYQILTEYRPVAVGLDNGPHTIRLQLVDSADQALSPDTAAFVNFTVQSGLGRTTDYMPILAYTNGALGLGILAILLIRHFKVKR